MTRYVYDFSEGNKDQKDLLGGKGANLAEMTKLGLPVPPGFTITTEACRAYLAAGADARGAGRARSPSTWRRWRRRMGKQLGDRDDPLLVSVRSGAKFSMPGMMETVLNIGLNDDVGARAREPGGQRAVRVGLLPPADPDVRQDRARHRRRAVRARARRAQAEQGRHRRPRPRRGRPAAAGRGVQGDRRASRRAPSSRRTRASSSTWRSRAVFTSWNTDRARALPPPGADPERPGHRGERGGDGVRQPRPGLRHRRRASPATRPPAPRASTATTCRTPRARTSSRGSATPCRWPTWRRSTRPPTTSCWRSWPLLEDALPRPVRHRVHHRARQAVDAADPGGQAHRRRGVPDRRPAGRRGRDRRRRGAAPGARAASWRS